MQTYLSHSNDVLDGWIQSLQMVSWWLNRHRKSYLIVEKKLTDKASRSFFNRGVFLVPPNVLYKSTQFVICNDGLMTQLNITANEITAATSSVSNEHCYWLVFIVVLYFFRFRIRPDLESGFNRFDRFRCSATVAFHSVSFQWNSSGIPLEFLSLSVLFVGSFRPIQQRKEKSSIG